MMKAIIFISFIILISCTRENSESIKHDVSLSDSSSNTPQSTESFTEIFKSIPKYQPNQLLILANELLNHDIAANEEITSSLDYRNKLKILNGNLLKSTDVAKEHPSILALFKKNIFCDNYTPDCPGHKLLKTGNFIQEVLVKIIISDINSSNLSSQEMLNAFYLAYEILKIKDKQILDRLFLIRYSMLRNSSDLDSNIKSVLDKRLGLVTDRLSKSTLQSENLDELIKSVRPWNYSNYLTDDSSNLQQVLFIHWIKQKPSVQQYQEALESDNLSILNQIKEFSPQILANLKINQITPDKCYYLLDRTFNKHLSSESAKMIVSSMDGNEKLDCIKQIQNFLKGRILITTKNSSTQLLSIIKKIKKEKISNIKIFEAIESRLSVLTRYWQNELEKFKSLEELLNVEFVNVNSDDFDQLKLSFEGLGEKFQMYAQYPSTLSLLYHFKDMISSNVGMDFSIKENDVSNKLEDLLIGGEWPVLDFGLRNYGVDKTLNQTKIFYSFQSALSTNTFNDLETPPLSILEFIIDHLPTREYKYLSKELATLKPHEINSSYKTVSKFCENHAKNFLINDSSKYKFNKKFSELSSSILFDAKKVFVVDHSVMERFPAMTEIARLDYERKIRFGRLLKDIYNEFASKQNNLVIISNDLYDSWAKKHLETQKSIFKTNLDYSNKSYSCLNHVKNIQKIITRKVFSYEYLFLKEVHKQMTLLRSGDLDNLQEANHIAQIGLNNFSKKKEYYFNNHIFSYSKIAFLFRLKHYLTSITEIGDKKLPAIANKLIITNDMYNFDENDLILSKDIPYHENVNIFIKSAMGNLHAKQSKNSFLDWWANDNTSYMLASKVNTYLQLYRTNIHGLNSLVDENKIISEILKNYKLLAIDETKNIYGISEKELFQLTGLEMAANVQNPLDNYHGVNINHYINSTGTMIHNIFNGPSSYFFNFAIGDTLISQQTTEEIQKIDEGADTSDSLSKNYGGYDEGYNYFRDKNSMGPLIFDGFETVESILDKEFSNLIKFDLDKVKSFHEIISNENIIHPLLKKYNLNPNNMLIRITDHESQYLPRELISSEMNDRLTDHYHELLDKILEAVENKKIQDMIR
ncbi:MAG: hypothetical protein A2381_12205 [Bdellovibrionales bacterium RIFOXYB1_FULL_37_110]|nr:MAG: hypothetical protein A2181_01925 [Bdellovibrionales bacterium RIFOXYA1_FULL_38_20]OFZ52258.1 MAG: hypothetical protein A2417_06045 [Bdellovibrionales bacterium RIFOXYC1_FULL_37_79]OFZ57245.1 MAG: hypothetical protein A2381_12205 [Bdellovibrionales bacterium RIFOXYB1_FULL_37_110]OFZ65247.1 MAG: hypothetical protein A2577_04640 [Bdellovibrionales bacterium RIFOXYD1_FULL_36_51]